VIKILVVDDEPGICDIIKKIFAPIGFEVLTAVNGSDAIAQVRKARPKLVFLDVRMLGMSGLQVLKEIKSIDSAIKVIMVSVMDDAATKKQALELGADEFVTKPFTSERLEELVRKEVAELVRK
jgi:DNA-binding response OmpR family regulator